MSLVLVLCKCPNEYSLGSLFQMKLKLGHYSVDWERSIGVGKTNV